MSNSTALLDKIPLSDKLLLKLHTPSSPSLMLKLRTNHKRNKLVMFMNLINMLIPPTLLVLSYYSIAFMFLFYVQTMFIIYMNKHLIVSKCLHSNPGEAPNLNQVDSIYNENKATIQKNTNLNVRQLAQTLIFFIVGFCSFHLLSYHGYLSDTFTYWVIYQLAYTVVALFIYMLVSLFPK